MAAVGTAFEQRGYDDPDVVEAIAELQQEYVRRYGQPDDAAVDPREFAPPDGLFLVCPVDGSLAAMGGWRRHDEHSVEIKRMYVRSDWRRCGYAKALLAELERRAAAAGYGAVVLNTGLQQPEAIALYERAGYTPIPGFGHYADLPLAVFLGKTIRCAG